MCRKVGLLEWMLALADRLRRVRVCCGDWARVVTPSCAWKVGGGTLTGVLLDPPYSHDLRDRLLYSIDVDIADQVRKWALTAGENSRMRIALCGLEAEHVMPGWTAVEWDAPRGYSKTPRREVIWFSPHCLRSTQGDLFEAAMNA
jgi:DNA adenine methylase